jgi:hypothetical protein
MPVDDRIPPFLTVEEASRLLKIGRTKAYLLTKEWRATGGRSGLPVVDLGDVLRVPGPAIEQMLGVSLGAPRPATAEPTGKHVNPTVPDPAVPGATAAPPEEPHALPAVEAPTQAVRPDADGPAPVAPARTSRQRRRPTNQLPLFQPLLPTNPEPLTPSPSHPEITTHS